MSNSAHPRLTLPPTSKQTIPASISHAQLHCLSLTLLSRSNRHSLILPNKSYAAAYPTTIGLMAPEQEEKSSDSPHQSQHHTFSDTWHANDGVVPLASQYHPGQCQSGTCTHIKGLQPSSATTTDLQPNHYYTRVVSNTTHATLCPLWVGSEEQKEFWRFVAGWMRDVEMTSEDATAGSK